MSKLPRGIRLDISRQMPARKWDVAKLLCIFKNELVARERCEQFDNLPSKEIHDLDFAPTTTLYSNSSQTFVPSCTYCNKGHPSNRCDVITDVVARKAYLRERNQCFNCLRTGHTANTCFSKYTCYHCKTKHHISICDKKQQPQWRAIK